MTECDRQAVRQDRLELPFAEALIEVIEAGGAHLNHDVAIAHRGLGYVGLTDSGAVTVKRPCTHLG
ncbi:hypothetical protein [Demequina litorisediminis]